MRMHISEASHKQVLFLSVMENHKVHDHIVRGNRILGVPHSEWLNNEKPVDGES